MEVYFENEQPNTPNDAFEKKLVAGILAILLGGFGLHKFYLGYYTAGFIQILLTLFCGIGYIIAIIEGVIYLFKSNEEFNDTYLQNVREWF